MTPGTVPEPLGLAGIGPRWVLMVAALWWGSFTALAGVAVPVLFAQLGNPALAGPVAAWLFSFLCKLTWVCGGLLILYFYRNKPLSLDDKGFYAIYFVGLAMLAAAVQDGLVAHLIVTARASGGNLKLWHGLGSGLVLVQWVAASVVLWRLTKGFAKP